MTPGRRRRTSASSWPPCGTRRHGTTCSWSRSPGTGCCCPCRAADGGPARAGLPVRHGQGAAKDEKEAAHWYEKASQQGDAAAQYSLGWMYEAGRGVSKDEAAASEWYRQAAEQGLAEAQCQLGLMCSRG